MISYRSAEPSDSAVLAQLHGEHFRRAWSKTEFDSFFLRDGVIGILAYHHEEGRSVDRPSPEPASLREQEASAGSNPIAFIFCWAVAGECELLALAVKEPYRAQGIARSLCEQAFEQAKEQQARMVHLEVAVSNQSAQQLYQSLGFEVIRRRKDYYHYPDGTMEDALSMRCDI